MLLGLTTIITLTMPHSHIHIMNTKRMVTWHHMHTLMHIDQEQEGSMVIGIIVVSLVTPTIGVPLEKSILDMVEYLIQMMEPLTPKDPSIFGYLK